MTKIKKISVLSLLIISIFSLAACTNTASSNVEIEDEKNMITVNHRLGETIVAENPERVIVFDYATLDTLDAMGIEVIGLPKSNIPTFLSKFNDDKYEDVGTLFEPDFEKIFELQPDVIFVSARQAEVYDELAKIAPTVFLEVDGADYMNSVTKNLTVLGEIFNKEEIVEAELEKINIAISELKEKVIEDEKNALIVMANDGNISAYGEGSRFGIVHSEFGFKPVDRNISVTKHGDNISFEYILEKNPEYI
ncbi:MAG: ABC transporter substrate-binding protein, partial [Clostridiales bacterium]|nr:ABC transporter substrate-binding protein [Clostridiales bacterium]